MGVLIDSNLLISLERAGDSVCACIRGREKEEIYLSVVSASELLHGVFRAKDDSVRAARSAFVEGVLDALPVLDIDLPSARAHAQLWSSLAAQGEMIGIHDSWLAAQCLAHGLTLVTRNVREFSRVPGLRVERW